LTGSNVVTDSSGTVAELLDYYPYGSARIDDQVSYNEQRKFTGQEYDSDTGLYYYNARYYNPAIGRFASQDPIYLLTGANNFSDRWNKNWRDIKSGDTNYNSQFGVSHYTENRLALLEFLSNPQNLNSYSYVTNNPLKYTDPTGEWEVHLNFLEGNLGLGGEGGGGWTIGFASDGTFGISANSHFGGLAGVDASLGMSAGYSTANTWSDTLGTSEYVKVGGAIGYGAEVTTTITNGKYSGTDIGGLVGYRAAGLPDVPVAMGGGVSKSVPVVQGSIKPVVDAVKSGYNAVKNTVTSGVNSVKQGASSLFNYVKSKF